jgi:hypothetical protein
MKTCDVKPREYATKRYGLLASGMVDQLTQFICDVLIGLEQEYAQVINIPDNFCDQCVDHYNEEHSSLQTGRLIMDSYSKAAEDTRYMGTIVQTTMVEMMYKDRTASMDHWLTWATNNIPGIKEYSNRAISGWLNDTKASAERMAKANCVVRECDSDLIANLTGGAFNVVLVDVKSIVHGYIKSCDPASINSLMHECREQVYNDEFKVDFNKCNLYLRTLLLSEAIKELCQQRVIILGFHDDGVCNTCDCRTQKVHFDVTFRQA